MFGYTMTPNSVNILIDGQMRTVDKSHANHAAVLSVLRDIPSIGEAVAVSRLRKLIDIPAYVALATLGRVTICKDAVLYNGVEVRGVISDRLLELLNGGFDVGPLGLLLNRVMLNPVQSARDELYLWLERSKMPLTADGCFLAYKKVRSDYKSYHDGATDNSIGTKLPPMDDVDTDRTNTCSRGYHFCSHDYLPSYYGSEGRVVVVKVAPEDVRAIPDDYDNAKGRASTYEIVGEVPEKDAEFAFVGRPVVTHYGTYGDSAAGDGSVSLDDRWAGMEEEEDEDDPFLRDDDDDDAAGDVNYVVDDDDKTAEQNAPILPPADALPAMEHPEPTAWWHVLLRR
ncbi:MAG: hypothetical protein IPO08_18380 [Xanthomonadales bacterium]|nr:hypothetical protein [Xanthomonadales bacterium]